MQGSSGAPAASNPSAASNTPAASYTPAAPVPGSASRAAFAVPPSRAPLPGAAAAHASAPGFWLQLGAFASADGARAALERFRRELAWLGARFDVHHEGGLYKVQAGPWPQRRHALDAAARVRSATALRPFAVSR
ncbi:MAG: SPOR domain-containing protein [Burkholderiaceae bacterium]|nr:SPOR domain-containing protein [Burkholderiaceae bacterium]